MPWIERVRTGQPLDAGVGIDWGNPITWGLLNAFLPASGTRIPIDLCNNTKLTVGSAATTRNIGPRGETFRFAGGGYGFDITTPPTLISSIVVLSSHAGGRSWFIENSSSTGNYFSINASNVPELNVASGVRASGTAITVGDSVVLGYIAANTDYRLYQNGILKGSNTSASGNFGFPNHLFGSSIYGSQAVFNVALMLNFSRALTPAEVVSLSANPWQLFEKERIWESISSGPVTHTTSGDLPGLASSVVGSASHIAKHPSSGALTGPGSAVVGSASRLRAFGTAGTLTGQGSVIAGSAARVGGATTHDTAGTLLGLSAALSGTAAHIAKHSTSGTLTGAGATLSGTALHNVVHAVSGDLVGPGSLLAGAALNGLASITKSGVNRLWLIDYYTKEFAAQEKLRQGEVAPVTLKRPSKALTKKIEAAVAKAEKDLTTIAQGVKNVQDAQVFIYNAIQRSKQAAQPELVDFLKVAQAYQKKMKQEDDDLLLLALVL